jgi:signal transduction histidine kinase
MRRTMWILALVGLAPLLVFAAMTAASQLRDKGERDLSHGLAVARQISAEVDGLLQADEAALGALLSYPDIAEGNWTAAEGRGRSLMREHPRWREILVTDLRSRREVWSTSTGAVSRSARAVVLQRLAGKRPTDRFGTVTAGAPGCPCLPIHRMVMINGEPQYVVTLMIDTSNFQQLLVKEINKAGVGPPDISAVFDSQGNFVARSVDYRKRVGMPGSIYVRRTLSGPPSGIYSGVTLEGLKNRTVYQRSGYAGLSTHIAMPDARFNMLDLGSFGLTLAALGIALPIAAAAVWYANREQQRLRLEEQGRIQAQKMEALGRFASGVAHDFNNVLQVILGCVQRLERLTTDPQASRSLSYVRQAAEKGAGLTQELVRFARERPIEIDRIELAPLLADIEGMMQRTLGPDIALQVEVSDPELAVQTNRSAFEMALLNLASNARDAMPGGGKLLVEGRPSKSRGCVDLYVADSGPGMPPEIAARAFDPFFTTKPDGKGTGLGLAQVHGLMLQSQGTISIASELGKGTAFTLTFPEG